MAENKRLYIIIAAVVVAVAVLYWLFSDSESEQRKQAQLPKGADGSSIQTEDYRKFFEARAKKKQGKVAAPNTSPTPVQKKGEFQARVQTVMMDRIEALATCRKPPEGYTRDQYRQELVQQMQKEMGITMREFKRQPPCFLDMQEKLADCMTENMDCETSSNPAAALEETQRSCREQLAEEFRECERLGSKPYQQ